VGWNVIQGAGADHGWSDVAEVADYEVPDGLTESAPGQIARFPYVELPESGWGALVGWVAGPHHLLRARDRLERHATVTTWRHSGRPTPAVSQRTRAEQDSVDRDINEYLNAAGVPARPPGYRWFIRLLPDFTDGDGFFSAVGASVLASGDDPHHPAQFLGPLTAHLGPLYSRTS
jgi:hypothetical protein